MPIEKEKATKSEQRDNGDIKECVCGLCGRETGASCHRVLSFSNEGLFSSGF